MKPREDRQYYVYILTNKSHSTLYVGVTNNLIRRLFEHKTERVKGFTSRYHLHKLVYFEVCSDVMGAIAREKQFKGGSRKKKIECIERMNPEWKDLSEDI